jgi:CheY-like chemotaxis protein
MEPRAVLVIDDNEATRIGLVELLNLRGYRTAMAANGREGLEMLRRDPSIGVVVLDLTMPVTDGYWFRARQLADPTIAHIPLIVFTGADRTEVNASLLSGAQVLYKPVDVGLMLETIASHCERT